MKKYRVKTPHGVFADGAWDHIEDVPEVLMDRWEHRFFVEDGEVVEVEMSKAEADATNENLPKLRI